MKTRSRLLFFLLLSAALYFNACGGGGSSGSSDDGGGDGGTVTYTVTFDSQGGSSVTSITVDSGTLATEPAAPTMPYYTFGGWYKEVACTTAWAFATDTVTADTTLYAKWTRNVWEDMSGNPQIISEFVFVSGNFDHYVYSTGSFSDVKGTASGDVYVAGCFERFQGQDIRSVAKLSGSTWTAVGGTTLDVNSEVKAICMTGSDIYIGGNFGYNFVSGNPVDPYGPKNIAKLNSSNQWLCVSTDPDFTPYTDGWTAEILDVLCDASGNIYVAGSFIAAGGSTAYSVAKFNGTSWSAVGADATYPGFVRYDGTNYMPAYMGGGIYQKGLHFDGSGNLYVAPNRDVLNRVDGAAFSYDKNTMGYENMIRWTGSAWEPVYDNPADSTVDVYSDYILHYNTDGTSYVARIAPPWGTKDNHANVQYSTDGGTTWTMSKDDGNCVIGPDGSAIIYGAFTSVRYRANFSDSYTVVDAKYLVLWKDGVLKTYDNVPSDISAVRKIFLMPSGDIWIIASTASAADSRLYRIKK